ncbi:cytochrome P450 family protein [Streptomyces boninensis]|uniref:cytochrome P450 family protein n=1 Tax=Streptomyces boninensis TaxID=2039455 RepID=UPI003B2250D9
MSEGTEIVDLTVDAGEFIANPYPRYAELRERGPVHRVLLPEGETWLVVGHDAVRAALNDHRLTKDYHAMVGERRPEEAVQPIDVHMLTTDPPDHTRLRKLVAREFTPRRVAALEPRIQEIADGLMDTMLAAPDRRADLLDALAFPLPMTVICELLGVPDLQRDDFRRWSNEILSPTSQESAVAAVGAMQQYMDELIEGKRATAPGDDLLSALIRTRAEDGDRLSHHELIGTAFLLLIAGHETTVNLIANGMLALLQHPEQLAALRADPGLLDGAVEESLRYDGPVEGATFRLATEDLDYGGGTVIPAGSVVSVILASAGRDPKRFPAPDDFDIRRSAQTHVAFGHGIHFCLGAPLARLEGRIAFRALLDRCPELALDADPGTLRWRPGLIIRGMRQLPVRW